MNHPPNPPADAGRQPPASRPKMNWLIFFAALLIPVIGSCIAGALDSRDGGFAPAIAMIGGGIGGIICGVTLARRFGRDVAGKIILGVIFSGFMAVACIGMSCFGCALSGYQMSFH